MTGDGSAPDSPDRGLWDALWDAVAEVRDAAPRTPDDADSGDIVDAVLDVIAPLLARAAEAEAAGFERGVDAHCPYEDTRCCPDIAHEQARAALTQPQQDGGA